MFLEYLAECIPDEELASWRSAVIQDFEKPNFECKTLRQMKRLLIINQTPSNLFNQEPNKRSTTYREFYQANSLSFIFCPEGLTQIINHSMQAAE